MYFPRSKGHFEKVFLFCSSISSQQVHRNLIYDIVVDMIRWSFIYVSQFIFSVSRIVLNIEAEEIRTSLTVVLLLVQIYCIKELII
mmetsp:Transcript_12182/g.18404  ORF Transcript_12182/g.18404 Transcript_12182/m.18404 type:complete len:86 (+) Transcript_12182:1293-1550(+)